MVWVYAILALSVLLIVHEFGHYLAAKAAGMHVDVFSVIGIGPVLLRLGHWRGTDFVISAIPFGAYVHIVGMEPEEDETDPKLSAEDRAAILAEREAAAKRAREMGYMDFRDRPAWAQALALFGGPGANYIAAMIIATGVFLFAGMPERVAVTGFGDASSPAMAAGIEPGDVIVAVDETPVVGENPALRLNEATAAHLGETVQIEVERDGARRTIPVALADAPPALGVNLGTELGPVPAGTALIAGISYPIQQTATQLAGLGRLITGRSKGNVGGPVEIVSQMKKSAAMGPASFLLFAALISTVLGMFNLLPIPALDGGRLVFILWGAITRRPVKPMLEATIHGYGLMALMAFLLFATWGDIRRLRQGDTPPAPEASTADDSADQASKSEDEPPATAPADAAASTGAT